MRFLAYFLIVTTLLCYVITVQGKTIAEQKALIKLQMQDSRDLAACRIAAARAK